MTKQIGLSGAKELLKTAGDTITGLMQTNAALSEKVAGYQLRDDAMKLAAEAEAKGLWPEHEGIEKKAAHILENADRFPLLQEMVKASAHQSLGPNSLGDGTGSSMDAAERFGQFMRTGVDPAD